MIITKQEKKKKKLTIYINKKYIFNFKFYLIYNKKYY